MDNKRKIKIANSFSDKYSETELNLNLTKSEFGKFENGIYAESMDEKWNIFLVDNNMYWTRSWTNICIYKVEFEKLNGDVKLINMKVNRNPNEYNNNDLKYDVKIFKQLLDFYLNKD